MNKHYVNGFAAILAALACTGAVAGPYVMRVPLQGMEASVATGGPLSLSTTSLVFGNVETGQAVTSASVTLTNPPGLAATGLSITPPSGYSVVSSTCGASLAASSSCAFSVKFSPTAAQSYNGNVAVNSSFGVNNLAVTGTGTTPSDSASAATLAFGNVGVNSSVTQSVTLTNTSDGPLNGINIYTGTSYYVAAQNCGTSLAKSQSCTINVTFTPTAITTYSDALTIASAAGTKTVSLSGAGIAATDPYISYVTLLAHMDGTNYKTTFTDVMGHTLSNGNTSVTYLSTAAAKFGTSSLYSTSTSMAYFQSNTGINTYAGDYTEEFWVYFTTTSGSQEALFTTIGAGTHGFAFGSGGFSYSAASGASVSGGTISTGAWHHLAATRAGTTIRLFLDGVMVGSYTGSNASGTLTPSGSLTGVNYYPGGGSTGINGYLDEIRITNGVARYTTNFTPPVAAFPDN